MEEEDSYSIKLLNTLCSSTNTNVHEQVTSFLDSLPNIIFQEYKKALPTLKMLAIRLSSITVDDDERAKLIALFARTMGTCTYTLVTDRGLCNRKLAYEYCDAFANLDEQFINNQVIERWYDICYATVNEETWDKYSLSILRCSMFAIANCKINLVDPQHALVKFLELVNRCACECDYKPELSDKPVRLANLFNNIADKYFHEVNDFPIKTIIRLYATTLFISETLSAHTISVSTLIKIDNLLQWFGSTKLLDVPKQTATCLYLYYNALRFLCYLLASRIHSSLFKVIRAHGHTREPLYLPNVEWAFKLFKSICHNYLHSGSFGAVNISEVESETILRVALASYALTFETKENTEGWIGFLEYLCTNMIQAKHQELIIEKWLEIGCALRGAKRLEEATMSFELCCQATWARVKCFCKKFDSRKNKTSGDLWKFSIAAIVKKASADIFSALTMSKERSGDGPGVEKPGVEVDKIIIVCLKGWYEAQQLFDIPCPVALVQEWIKIQIQKFNKPDHSVPTIQSLSHSTRIPEENLLILLNQGFQEYQQTNNNLLKHDSIGALSADELKRLNTTFLLDNTDCMLQRSKHLIDMGMGFRERGVEGLNDCIEYILEAITILLVTQSDLYKEILDDHGANCSLLAKAYCLHALYTREAEPGSNRFMASIVEVVSLWLKENSPHSSETPGDDFTLLCYVVDILSLEDRMEHHGVIYKHMFKYLELMGVPSNEWLHWVWDATNVSHIFCPSPLSNAFLMTAEEHKLEFGPTSCNDLQSLDFKQRFSITSIISSQDKDNQTHAVHPHITIEEVEKAASELAETELHTRNLKFLAAHLYYNLAERLIARGLMTKAFYYAKKSYALRQTLFHDFFEVSKYDHLGEAFMNGHKGIRMKPSVAIPRLSDDAVSRREPPLTPWNVCGRYLESMLQVETIEELLGNVDAALEYLLNGMSISSILNLQISKMVFGTALGKVYRKQREWVTANEQLRMVSYTYEKKRPHISCKKCARVISARLHQELGDLHLNPSDGDKPINQTKSLEYYTKAEAELNDETWKNLVSFPKESARTTTFCKFLAMAFDQSLSTSAEGSDGECWHCVPSRIKELEDVIRIKWEYVRRRLLLRLLIRMGKCTEDEENKLLYGISVLLSRSTFGESYLHISSISLLKLIEKNVIGDAFAIDYALILYNLCEVWLKKTGSKNTRYSSTNMHADSIPQLIVSGLKLCFVLSYEVTELCQQVSRLLAVLYTLSPQYKQYSMFSSACKDLSRSQLASYFHQASLGTQLNHQFLSSLREQKDQNTKDVGGSCIPRMAPQSVQDLERFVLDFFTTLPPLPVICFSMFGDGFAVTSLLNDLLPGDPPTAWIMLSRLNSNCMPISIILPLVKVFKDINFEFSKVAPARPWVCPWENSTIVDKVAPVFRPIVKEICEWPEGATKTELRELSIRRNKLDGLLSDLFGDMENSWFGNWRSLLLGEWSGFKHLDPVVLGKLTKDLEPDVGGVPDESIVKVIIECAQHASDLKAAQPGSLLQLIKNKGCYFGGAENFDVPQSFSKFLLKAIDETRKKELECREPVILVLDNEIQMIPWEHLPLLRNQEIYRMPSLVSILCTLSRCCNHAFKDSKDLESFPTIDPLNAYYLLNPDEDRKLIEKCFLQWFCSLKLKGVAGTFPHEDELSKTLEQCDLYIYIGHGSGSNIISGQEIQKIGKCPAAILGGCSSGAFFLQGEYAPVGTPLDYLLAGSPAIIASLWAVSVGDNNKFIRQVLEGFINASEASITDCAEYTSKKRKISDQAGDITTSISRCKHKTCVGSMIGKGRDACELKSLTGAAYVCYGIPTILRKR